MTMNYKQQATADVLVKDLALILGVTVTEAFVDANAVNANATGDTVPVLTIGNVATTAGGVTLVIANQRGLDTGAAWQDIVGNAQPVYTGMIYKVIHEDNLAALDVHVYGKVMALLSKRGGAVESWKVNSGQSANLAGAGLALEFTVQNNTYYPLEDRA